MLKLFSPEKQSSGRWTKALKKTKWKGHSVYHVATVSNAVHTSITWLNLILEQAEFLSLVTSIRVAKGQFQHLEINWELEKG